MALSLQMVETENTQVVLQEEVLEAAYILSQTPQKATALLVQMAEALPIAEEEQEQVEGYQSIIQMILQKLL